VIILRLPPQRQSRWLAMAAPSRIGSSLAHALGPLSLTKPTGRSRSGPSATASEDAAVIDRSIADLTTYLSQPADTAERRFAKWSVHAC
jgi:hypothetical protein